MPNRTNVDQLVFEWALDDVRLAYWYLPPNAIERSQLVKNLRWMCECRHVPTVVDLIQQIQERGTYKLKAESELDNTMRSLHKVVMQRQKHELLEWAQVLRRLSRHYVAIAFWPLVNKYSRGPRSRHERTRKRNHLVEIAQAVGITDPDATFKFIEREDGSLLKGRNGKLMTPASVMLQFKRQNRARLKRQKSAKHQD